MTGTQKVYALNLFDVVDGEKYLTYLEQAGPATPAYGGQVIAVGRFCDDVEGDVKPRQLMIVMEWDSKEAFDAFRADPVLADVHPQRDDATANYVWQLFEHVEDLGPLLGPIG